MWRLVRLLLRNMYHDRFPLPAFAISSRQHRQSDPPAEMWHERAGDGDPGLQRTRVFVCFGQHQALVTSARHVSKRHGRENSRLMTNASLGSHMRAGRQDASSIASLERADESELLVGSLAIANCAAAYIKFLERQCFPSVAVQAVDTQQHAGYCSRHPSRSIRASRSICGSRRSAECVAQRTTLTPMDLAVPTMLLQIDSSRTNSLPGSVCFTCQASTWRSVNTAEE